MNSDEPEDWSGLEHDRPAKGVQLERLSRGIDSHYAQGTVSDIEAHMPRDGSRIVALTNQLSQSQANLESASAQFNELASAIPGDIVDLSDRLSGILNGAVAEADDSRAAAHRFADELRTTAQHEAAAILADAEAQRREAAELRAELETEHKNLRAQASHLRRQAVLSAAEIMREAEDHASAILTEMNHAISTHVTDAQRRLAELIDARAKIVDQIERSTSEVNRQKHVNDGDSAKDSLQVARESALSARESWFRENHPR
ncbi:M protein [[Mycobacterium] kokjensenii]|uniref:M protein n=1 Tax=[Mycobacterium] kokjensenii TaxID=3064287 RepID=A0ABN9N1A0_9MYCO|nr:M protein [Mycolicibacter sp. MU0083]CAJ1498699.1 M protein [Mycolicibacter sp. MU0083]